VDHSRCSGGFPNSELLTRESGLYSIPAVKFEAAKLAPARAIQEIPRHFKHGVRSLNMHEIICPHCTKAFKIDEAGYADILKQVRDDEFDQQLHQRLELADKEKRDAVVAAEGGITSCRKKQAEDRAEPEIERLGFRLAEEMSEQPHLPGHRSIFRFQEAIDLRATFNYPNAERSSWISARLIRSSKYSSSCSIHVSTSSSNPCPSQLRNFSRRLRR